MSGVTTPTGAVLQTATPPTTSSSPNKSKLAIIVVASIGGFIFIVALILVIVPFARRRASRCRPKLAESSTSSEGTSTTAHSRREIHNRAISADASVPLLEHDPVTSPEFGSSRLGSTTALSDTTTQLSPPHNSNTDSLRIPRRFAPFKSFSAHSPSPDLEPGLSRSLRPPPPQPLRHARTRIAHMPMDPLPEDLATDVLPQRVPSPMATSTESHAPASTTWLHIPKTPLIGAFRGSISSLASAASSSLHTIQHYPSFSRNTQSASASSRSSQTFYTVDSDGPTAHHNVPASEHGEFLSPGLAARFKPGGVGERIPQLHLRPLDGGIYASRQASMVDSPNPSILSVPRGLRSSGRPVSSTVASGSSLSLYTDARSQLGGGEDRKNGSLMNPYNFHVFPPLPHLRIIPDRCRYPKSTRLDISMRISLLRTRRPVDPLSGSTNGFSRLAFEIGLAGCRKTQNSISENRVGMTTQHLDPYSGSEASLTISPVPPRVLSSGLGPSDDILWDQVHEKTSVRNSGVPFWNWKNHSQGPSSCRARTCLYAVNILHPITSSVVKTNHLYVRENEILPHSYTDSHAHASSAGKWMWTSESAPNTAPEAKRGFFLTKLHPLQSASAASDGYRTTGPIVSNTAQHQQRTARLILLSGSSLAKPGAPSFPHDLPRWECNDHDWTDRHGAKTGSRRGQYKVSPTLLGNGNHIIAYFRDALPYR
ncbi:hypothetical protein BJV78DRAFT_1159030 [Lactifluus subvellereus]|nr:hypothetical protein BJV78DRAFT_1159030 [Lactifluus subvellereus]